MATVSLPYTLTAGDPENVNQLRDNLNALVTGVNSIDAAQISSGAITTAKIADAAVTSAKLAPAPYGELATTTLGVNDNTLVDVDYTTTTHDNGVATTGTALADLANNRLYLRRAGLWSISASVAWQADIDGWRSMAIYWSALYGAPVAQDVQSQGFGTYYGLTQTTSTVLYTNSTSTYIYGNVYQNSGGNWTNISSNLKAVWLGNYS